jgi:hypothetical protein
MLTQAKAGLSQKKEVVDLIGAPRPMKMGTTLSL